MSMVVHLSKVGDLRLIVPIAPWPEGLDKRWTPADVPRFVVLTRQFVRDTAFQGFLESRASLYATTDARMKAFTEKEGHLEWFNDYFGEKSEATFTITPALFNGGACYGAHCRGPAGKENLYCILGVWKTGPDGLPEFTSDMIQTVVHEFGHSYANPIVDRHLTELEPAGDALFQHVATQMRSQAYGNGQTMLRESLVRACEVRFAFRYGGLEAGRRPVAHQERRGILWMEGLCNLLSQYERQRDQYPTLDSFSPRLVTFFNADAADFVQKRQALETDRPKIVSMRPSHGAEGVDPSLSMIQVVFDRPMKDRS